MTGTVKWFDSQKGFGFITNVMDSSLIPKEMMYLYTTQDS